jgi:adenylate cyclase
MDRVMRSKGEGGVITYEFGEWLVEPELGQMHRDHQCVHLEPKTLAVLTCLLNEAGDVVSKDKLLRTVWPDRVIEANAVSRNIAVLRRALGDESRQSQYIETIPKHGYRAVAPVRRIEQQAVIPDISVRSRGMVVTLAVLPFDNLSSDEELLYFSDGVSEEILHAVSKTTDVKVIGRTSSFQFRGADKDVHHVARALGCSHVLDGSVRCSDNRIRVAAQLIECANQTTVWSDRFDRELEDVFALQDEVADAVAKALDAGVCRDANRMGSIDPFAFDLYLRAKASSAQWLGACDAGLLEQAVARAPTFAEAWATLAVTRAVEAHLERDPERSEPPRRQAIKAARQALRLDSTSASAYAALSIAEPICGRFQERDALIADALRAEPTNAVSLFWACRWSWAVGRNREGLDYIARACQVEPLWAQGLHQYATMLWLVGQDQEAERLWDRLTQDWPDRDYLWGVPLGLNAHLGNWKKVDELSGRLAATGLDTVRTRIMAKRVERFRNWNQTETNKLARELTEELERTGTIRFYLQWACDVGLTELVYDLVERASFQHLFKPSGRVSKVDFGLHALFFREGKAMYDDPRFVRLCARLGLCDYWVRTDRWPDCADKLAVHYDFRDEARRHAARGHLSDGSGGV